jgi:hypothetical protein
LFVSLLEVESYIRLLSIQAMNRSENTVAVRETQMPCHKSEINKFIIIIVELTSEGKLEKQESCFCRREKREEKLPSLQAKTFQ